ncbi:helix-turn-helix domain-containing protein [Rhizobium sp.]|uniref:helix-turn-helix domain-containing protein n=1 Tax=Rhizobium TaxID=379 RepID=UPI0039823912
MPIPWNEERLLTPAEAAARLAISTKTLLRHADDGQIACVNVGTQRRKHRRFAISQLSDFITSHQPTEVSRCLSTSLKAVRSTTTTLRSAAIAFTELPRPGTNETRKP